MNLCSLPPTNYIHPPHYSGLVSVPDAKKPMSVARARRPFFHSENYKVLLHESCKVETLDSTLHPRTPPFFPSLKFELEFGLAYVAWKFGLGRPRPSYLTLHTLLRDFCSYPDDSVSRGPRSSLSESWNLPTTIV